MVEGVTNILEKFQRILKFDIHNPPELLDIDERRAFGHEIYDAIRQHTEMPSLESRTEMRVESDGGPPVPVTVYRPHGDPRGIYVYFHGGAWTTGSAADVEPHCANVCADAGFTVVNVDYRLAPESPFPAAVEDAYTAVSWAHRNRGVLAHDAAPIVVGGTSAGANLATVAAAMARDRGGPPIAFQYLDVPALDATMSEASVTHASNSKGVLNPDALRVAYAEYLGSKASATDPYVSPLLAPHLEDLPPALIVTAELDPLRDEGRAYAQRLGEAGVAVRLHCYAGVNHGFTALEYLHHEPGEAHVELVAALRACVSGEGAVTT